MLSMKSLERLTGVHPDLVRVVKSAADMPMPGLSIMVLEGLRTMERQKELVAKGASQTLRSRHLTGHAVDLGVMIGDELRWDWPLYARLAEVVKAAAASERVPLEWGGDWVTLKDGPHFQLPWKDYP